MIERLDQLSLQNFIDLTCGDLSVLKEPDEQIEENIISNIAIKLINEYKYISSPIKAKIDMLDSEQEQKLLMKEKCTRIAIALCLHNRSEYALEILAELEIDTSKLDTAEKIMQRCKILNNDAKYELERLAEQKLKDNVKAKDSNTARKEWYSEIAWVMSIFKMSIDTNAVNAAIYANLVNQAVQRAKQLAKMPRMMAGML